MSEIYNEEYYHNGCGPIPYEEPEHWVEFFGMIADRIVKDIHPQTVLDAGCAMGYLVAALRDRGVEAYGVDISEYAISKVREDVRPFCRVASLTEAFPNDLPQHYDLVVTIEVLEHLYAEDGQKAIANLCKHADTVLFSSTPDDFEERTHVNVQQREYWAKLFFEQGFTDDINYRPRYLTPYASLFRKNSDMVRQIEDYERLIARYDKVYALQRNKWSCKVYFDFGQGMSETSCNTFDVVNNNIFSQRIRLPQGCKSIRFDPVEGAGCLVWNLKARTENNVILIKQSNGLSLNGVMAFAPNDPQIYFEDFQQQYQYIELSADILLLEQDGWMYFCKSIQETMQSYNSSENKITEMEVTIKELQNELKDEIAKQEIKEDESSAELKRQADEFTEHVEELEKALSAAQQEINDYSNLIAHERGEAAKIAEAYHTISTSTFWKLTKPGRLFMDITKKCFVWPLRKVLNYLKMRGLSATLKKIKQKITGQTSTAPIVQSANPLGNTLQRSSVTGNPIDAIAIIDTENTVNRLNLVTDTIEASSLLGGVATALIVATEFANRYGYELRIITRNAATNPVNYMNIMSINGIEPARKLSFYSDYERFDKPVDFRMEAGKNDIFFATSWWSAQAIKNTTIRPRFFYIIQEVETFFYNYGSEHFLCEQIMQDKNIDFIINSHYLKEYFAENCPNIAEHSCYFEPAFSQKLYGRNSFIKKNKYKLFFYARPNNPRNLYGIGVELLQKAVDRGVLDMDEWDVYCVGQNAPIIHFSTGKDSINMGQLSWTEYAKFLTDVDLGLCLMYTPHPSYPPFDVACSGGVVLTNKMLNKQSFDMCDNVIMTELNDEAFMQSFSKAIELAKNMDQRKRNYELNTIPREWSRVLNDTMIYMEEATKNV